MICIDWKDIKVMKKDPIKDHSSYANLLMEKKNDTETLTKCLNKFYQDEEETETICCHENICTISNKFTSTSNNLIVIFYFIIDSSRTSC